MSFDQSTNVLIVGAGPVGMMTALALAEEGVKSMIIDGATRGAQRSFACALHPRSLEILEGYDLWDDIVEWGRRVESLAFYDGAHRRAELDLVRARQRHPFLMVLPQSGLEWMMERTLRDWAGITVLRGYQLTKLSQNDSGVFATVRTPAQVSSPARQSSIEIRAEALVGADGRNSSVRSLLEIPYDSYGADEHFVVFEYDTETFLDREIRIVLDSSSTNVFWPIAEHRCRWMLQVDAKTAAAMPPYVDGPDSLGRWIEGSVLERAPWFQGRVKNVHWISPARFERRLAARFAEGRCRLVGDAAHQTGPVGVQSMNVGLLEAVEVAKEVIDITAGDEDSDNGRAWNERCRHRWLGLLAANGFGPRPIFADDWLNHNAERLIPCLPASLEELPPLLSALQAAE